LSVYAPPEENLNKLQLKQLP